jgi:hypothetical protein
MANSEVIGGIDTRVLYGVESTYGTPVATGSIFGGLIKSASFDIDRQVVEHAGFAGTGASDGRITAKFTTGVVNVRGNVDFEVQRWDWLEYLRLRNRKSN